jgi:hypothetical protein
MDVVVQAVGRVRPYTKPREVITFQCGEHSQLKYTSEFHSVEAARRFFEIPSLRERKQHERTAQVQAAKAEGRTQQETARMLGVSVRTVKRYWNA